MACSYFNRFVQHALAYVTVQFVLGYHLHPAIQQLGKLIAQWYALGKEAIVSGEFHQKVHIAAVPFLAPGYGTKRANAASAVLVLQAVDGVTLFMPSVDQQGASF